MTAEEMFDNYRKIKSEREMLSYQISHFVGLSKDDVIEAMTFARPESDERVQTSNISDKTAKIAMNYQKIQSRENDDYHKFMIKRCQKIDDEIRFFEYAISLLGEPRSNIVFEMLNGEQTWSQISYSNHVSKSMLKKYRKTAIAEVEKQFQLRDELNIQYMLS